MTPAGASASDLNLSAVILAGGTAGVAMWSIAIPPDVSIPSTSRVPESTHFVFQVIKSRIQSAPSGTYSGFIDCARKTIAADGVTALWKGLGPAMARVSTSSQFT